MNKRSFARPASASSRPVSRFGGARKPALSGASRGRFNNSRPSFKRGGASSRHGGANKKRFGDLIDFSRFIKKGELVEEKPYVSKHTFADFPFDPQLHKNIERAGFTSPRPIQDQAIPSVMKGTDVFGMANTGTGKTAAFLLPLIEKIRKNSFEIPAFSTLLRMARASRTIVSSALYQKVSNQLTDETKKFFDQLLLT